MTDFISSASFLAGQSLVSQGVTVKRSHLSEVIAALLGYGSLAALQAERASPMPQLEDAERLVLCTALGKTRVLALGLDHAVLDACVSALVASSSIPVHLGVEGLYDDYAREVLEQTISEGENVSNVMAESNAFFPDYPDLEGAGVNGTHVVSGDLWSSIQYWSMEDSGSLTGEYDLDKERMYNGHSLDVWGKLTFSKAGRAGLILEDSEEGASADEDWRDESY